MSLFPNSNNRGKDIDGLNSTRVTRIDTYAKKDVLLDEMEKRGLDINTLPLLVNNINITITLNDGSLIYTE